MDLESAESDEGGTGERPARLLQAATGRETAEVDRHEAEALDHALDEFGRLWVIPGDEDDAAATILYRPFIEASGDDRIERLHDPGARPATTSLAPLPPRSASTSLGLYSMNGFVASMSTRPFHAGRPRSASSTFGQGTASRT